MELNAYVRTFVRLLTYVLRSRIPAGTGNEFLLAVQREVHLRVPRLPLVLFRN